MDSGMLWVIRKTVFGSASQIPLQFDIHPLARQGVESAERLVHQQQRRIVDQSAHDRHALLHAARQLGRILAFEIGKSDKPKQVMRAAKIGLAAEIKDPDRQHHILKHRQPGQQHRRLEDEIPMPDCGPRNGADRNRMSPSV